MRVSVVQMNSSSLPDKNMEQVRKAFETASKRNADLLVFPENMLAMAARFKALVETEWSQYTEALCELAMEFGVPCIAGTLPLPDEENLPKRLASSLFINAKGELIGRYNKIHLFDVDVGDEKGAYRESKYYSPGATPVVVSLKDAVIGMTVCFDLRFPDLFQAYKKHHANMIVVPSAFTALTGKKHWEILLRARAIETQSYIIAPNQVGKHDDGRSTWGHSMIVSPDGEVLLDMENRRGTETLDLDLKSVEGIRRSMPLNSCESL